MNIPARGGQKSGEMETAIPVERKPLFRGMETDHQCAYHVVMRFAQRGQIAMGGVIPTALRDGGGSKYEKRYGWIEICWRRT